MRLPIFLLLTATILHAAPLEPVPLWPAGAPGALGEKDDDKPTLTPFLPAADKATGAAIVVFPGGGYGGLAPHEGAGYAEWLANGIAAFVPSTARIEGYRHSAMLNAARAPCARPCAPRSETIRSASASSDRAPAAISPRRSSRISPPASPTTLILSRESSRPDLGILCYAVITMGPNTHQGSKTNLLGNDPAPDLVELLSNEKQVTKDTPPCFIWHTGEDNAVKVENSLEFAAALRRAGVPFDLHVYQKGAHGIGLGGGRAGGSHHPWAADCLFWLKVQGFAK